ncbi:hypothetical protein DAPPUDRAFT_109011, partial [Daphnia pulex]
FSEKRLLSTSAQPVACVFAAPQRPLPSVSCKRADGRRSTETKKTFWQFIKRYKMPKEKPVVSLFSQCIDCICKFKCNIPVNAKRFKTWTGSPWSIQLRTDSESSINPFRTIPELQKLIVPYWYRYNYEQFLNFFPKLEKLQTLALCYSNIDNSCLKIIGTWCKNLRILNVNGCNRLTDTGIEWLIQKPTELNKTLEVLLLNCAAVTKRGIKMAVENFPALQIVSNGSTFDVLLEMAQSAAQAQPHKNSSFTHLAIHSVGVYTSGLLGSVMRYCPSLFEIIIEVKVGFTDTDLFCLTSLKNLQTLKLFYHNQSYNGREITFDKGLAPVLKLLRLENCHLVTKQGLDELAIKENILKKIRIYFCQKSFGTERIKYIH